jgi:uncharacterized protein
MKVSRVVRVAGLALCFMAVASIATAAEVTEGKDTGKVFMWEAKGNGATVYLLGSLHACGPDMYPLNPAIEDAYGKSDVLVLEMDMSPETVASAVGVMTKEGIYSGDDSLEKHLSESTMTKLEAFLKERGMQITMVRKFKPWYLVMALAMQEVQRLGYDPSNGIDLHFVEKASAASKPIKGLETPEEQITALSSGLEKIQEKELNEFMDEVGDTQRIYESMAAAWKAGSAEAMDAIIKKELSQDPEVKDFDAKVIRERSVRMADRIADMTADGKTYLVIVGAAHLVGEKNVRDLLAAKGFTVTQVEKAPVMEAPAVESTAAVESSAPTAPTVESSEAVAAESTAATGE